jgi:hypothetical protein
MDTHLRNCALTCLKAGIPQDDQGACASRISRLPCVAMRRTHTHLVMDRTGDTRHHFDAHDQAAVAEAEKRFIELTGAGFTAAKRTASG